MVTDNGRRATEVTTPSDREIVVTRTLDAPRGLVWDAWTDCRHLSNWILDPQEWSLPVCEIDLRPGGSHRSAWRKSDGTEMEIRGVYREVTEPERLVYTESWDPDMPATVDTLTLSEEGGGTTVTLVMLFPSKQARDAALEMGTGESMSDGFDRLDALLRAMR